MPVSVSALILLLGVTNESLRSCWYQQVSRIANCFAPRVSNLNAQNLRVEPEVKLEKLSLDLGAAENQTEEAAKNVHVQNLHKSPPPTHCPLAHNVGMKGDALTLYWKTRSKP